MESKGTKASAQSLTRSSFSIKSILNLQDEQAVEFPGVLNAELEDAKCFMSAPSAPSVQSCALRPPLLYPCIYGLPMPQYGSVNWPSFGAGQQLPAWIYNTRFMRHEFYPGYAPYMNLRRRRRLTRKKKQRPLFSQQQVQTMEEEFNQHRYVAESKRAELASELGLTETQIKTWFQNRRTKWRKELRDEVATTVAKTQKRWQEGLSVASTSNTEELRPSRSAFDVCKTSEVMESSW